MIGQRRLISVTGLAMRLTSAILPAIENACEADIDWAFENGAIGGFFQLSASDDSFIEAASSGTPAPYVPPDDPMVRDHWAFIHRTGSEPWRLEHHRLGRSERV